MDVQSIMRIKNIADGPMWSWMKLVLGSAAYCGVNWMALFFLVFIVVI